MKFKIMGEKGDLELDYDPAIAQIKFDELVADKMLPVVYKGGKMKKLDAFDPDAKEVTWIPSIMGG